MAESIVSDVVVKLLGYVGKAAVEIAPYFGGKRKLKELEKTMVMIQARLLDAERRGEGRNGEQVVKEWLQRLKSILYQLEDLFEEVIMVDKAKEQVRGGKLTKPIRHLFSSSNPLKLNKKVAEEGKAIMEELNSITSLMNSLNFREIPVEEHCRVVSVDIDRETHSLVLEDEVIGRDKDKNKIVAMLLDSDPAKENVSVIPIVGIGGMGKTTLAQLVFNDKDVQEHFDKRYWACISDISTLHELAGKTLMSISGVDYRQLTLNQIQCQLCEEVSGKMYLLIFDDIWDEDHKRWLELSKFLRGGKPGSKIIVTTRSKVVAQNMGTVETLELKGLPEGKSWDLFRRLAFKEGQEEGNSYLASISKEIVKKCANVPLAIKSIACLLSTMDLETEWEAFKDKNLAMIEQDHKDTTLLTLKLSYERLPSELKQCFAYCSLFPKDYVLLKRDLIYLWMAQGFLGSSSGHQSLEDVGHGYFMQLMRRCFFQDIKFDIDGEIFSCKMHDIVHDLAQLVAGGDILVVDGPTQQFNNNIWHVSICSKPVETPWLLATKQMRSLFHMNMEWRLDCGGPFPSMRCLRTLYFGVGGPLPNSSELKHLRCLKLGSERCLSEDITRLPKLQTLDLSESKSLEVLPMGFSKLINLRHLHFNDDVCLNDMPPGFGQLTSLRLLDRFIVGENNGLGALSTLNHLAGRLKIDFKKHHGNSLSEATEGILKDTKLTGLELIWPIAGGGSEVDAELALRCLQPP